MEITKPYCLLAYRWLFAWIHLLHSLSDRHEALQPYHEWFSQLDEHVLVESVQHFFDYFVALGNIKAVAQRQFTHMTPLYGKTWPLGLMVQAFSERDQDIFRTFTMDVYLSVVDPIVAEEVGIVLSDMERLKHFKTE
jgi:hypothetical protein|uniref:Uncharacterized protein n=1 Tax=viral metagenome TaxID=1070528 RepID=A0A6C0ICE4_9ZZZZ